MPSTTDSPDSPRNFCASCGEDFASVRAFDRHRVGSHEVVWSLENEHGRRCLDAGEMRAAGMAPCGRGRWQIVSEVAAVRGRFAA